MERFATGGFLNSGNLFIEVDGEIGDAVAPHYNDNDKKFLDVVADAIEKANPVELKKEFYKDLKTFPYIHDWNSFKERNNGEAENS